jgi:ATP-binding cassette subfamily B protein
MVWEVSGLLFISTISLRLLKSLLPATMLWTGKLIIDAVVDPAHTDLWKWVLVEAALAVVNDMTARAIALLDSLLGDRFTNHVSVRLMRHASALDLAHFEDAEFYDKLERARRQSTGRLGLLGALSSMAQDAITLATLSIGLIWYYPWLVLLLSVAVIPAFLGETHFAGLAYSMLYRWTPQRRELDYVRMLGASNQSAKEVKIFGLGEHLAQRYRSISDRFYAENRSLALKRAGTGAGLNLVAVAGYYSAYAIIISRTLSGQLSLGDLTFLAGSFAKSRGLVEGLLGGLANTADQALYLSDLFEFFDMRPRLAVAETAIPAPRPIASGFEFRNVGFRYPGSNRVALNGVSFRIEAGERVAVIGENGAGKTTLVKLLARLYDPDEGAILLDGIDLREYDPASLRSEIGVIFQDYMRYDMAVRDNIGFGRVEALGDQARIEDAARKSLAEAVVAGLQGGYDQMLGRRFESGADLSAGQWQKIALARAYMRDAQILILDEPTASIDARAEYEVFLRFADLTKGRMAVLISHRFSTVRMADRILVLEGGRLIESGTHRQLVALGGRYAELFELQAAGYR